MKPIWEQKHIKFILNLPPLVLLATWSKKIVLPGFDGMPLFDVMVFFLKGLIQGSLAQRAASIAYNFFMAIFPALLFFFTLIPYIPIHDFQSQLMHFLELNLPQSAYTTIFSTVSDILSRPRGGLLSIGFVMAMFFSTNGFKSIMMAFNMSYHHVESRGFWQMQWTSFILVFIAVIITILVISLIGFSSFVLDWMVDEGWIEMNVNYYIILYSEKLILIAMVFFIISFIYYLAPGRKNRFKFFSAGSSFATILYVLSYIGFNFYINNFSKYNALYGSIGTLIIFLLWIYFIATILLIGFELNISIQRSHRVKELK